MKRPFTALATLLLAASFPLHAADLRLPSIFSDHMVLQSAKAVPVWGLANASEQIVVEWQKTTIAPERLINRFNQKPMSDWSGAGKIHFLPKQGSDLTKVIFADFQWATPDVQKP